MDQRNESSQVDVIGSLLKSLRNLEQELDVAIEAIKCNRLQDFEGSLWRQETQCARLKRSISTASAINVTPASRIPLREAASRLKDQTQIYEKLVKQSSRSAAFLQQLCSLYRNAAHRPERPIYGSISREV